MLTKEFKLLIGLLFITLGFAVLIASQLSLTKRIQTLEAKPIVMQPTASPSATIIPVTVTPTKMVTKVPTVTHAATTSGRLK
jgi:hypothetical protein